MNEQATEPTKTMASFDPESFLLVPAKRFEDLKVGDIFRAPSRTLTDAHASAFQVVSADNHPVHYDAVWAARHGHSAPVVHGLHGTILQIPERGSLRRHALSGAGDHRAIKSGSERARDRERHCLQSAE